MAIGMDGGGGIHPGAPLIWPKIPPVKQTTSAEETSATSRNVKTQTAPESSAAQAADSAPAAPPPAPASAQAASAARPMSMSDIVDQLLSHNIPNTPDNKQMASFMMEHGLELSQENFTDLFKMLKGNKNPAQLESAVISLSKGLTGSSKSVEVLSQFLTNSPQLSPQIQELRTMLAQFQSQLTSGPNLLNPGLTASLLSIVSDMDDTFKKLNKKATEGNVGLADMKKGALLKDIKAFEQFLGGLEKQLAGNPQAEAMRNQMAKMRQELSEMMNSLTSQSILSKDSARQPLGTDDKFAYWQIPNPLTKESNMELLIRKDPQRKKGALDPKKTRIILKMETPDLGEISIIIDVLENRVWYIFNTSSEETKAFITKMNNDLKQRMAQANFQLSGMQAIQKRLDIRKYILPTLNLDSVMRIHHEV